MEKITFHIQNPHSTVVYNISDEEHFNSEVAKQFVKEMTLDIPDDGTIDYSFIDNIFFGSNSPKLPNSQQLERGEISINLEAGYETLAIKNSIGNIMYLPFNLAQRMLKQEELLQRLGKYSVNNLETIKKQLEKLEKQHNKDIESLRQAIKDIINGDEDKYEIHAQEILTVDDIDLSSINWDEAAGRITTINIENTMEGFL